MLALRQLSEAAPQPSIEWHPRQDKPKVVWVLPDRDAVVSFRKEIDRSETRNVVKFVHDIDVPVDHIVHAFNLSRECGWPHLKTFCRKAVGIEPMDVRMMRRKSPCEARLIFHSREDAQNFLERVPANNWLRGTIPRFEIEYKVPAAKTGLMGRSSSEHRRCTIVDVVASSAEVPEVLAEPEEEPEAASSDESREEEVASAVVRCDEGEKGGEQSSEEFPQDVCVSCFKGGRLPPEQFNNPVYSAVVQPIGKAHHSAKKSKKSTGERAQGQASKKRAKPSVTAICVAHLTARLAVHQ